MVMGRSVLSVLAAACASVLVGAVAVGGGRPASACSCAGVSDRGAFDRADAVFTGDLVNIVTPGGETYSSTDPERFVFEVDAVYKGDALSRQSIVTAREGASCGLEISGRGPFLVFATTHDSDGGLVEGAKPGELYSNLCSGTRAESASAVPALFGRGHPPRQAPEGIPSGAAPLADADRPDEAADGVPYWMLLVPVVLASVGGVTVVLVRRRAASSGT